MGAVVDDGFLILHMLKNLPGDYNNILDKSRRENGLSDQSNWDQWCFLEALQEIWEDEALQ